MAGSKVLQLLLLISLVTCITHALKVLLTDGKGPSGFSYETEINFYVESEAKIYNGCVESNIYTAGTNTKKVIVYIKSRDQMFGTILQSKFEESRANIANELCKHKYEILYLAVSDFNPGEAHLIAEFLDKSIKSDLPKFEIKTIGEKSMNLKYQTVLHDLERYKEQQNVYGAKLQAVLRMMGK